MILPHVLVVDDNKANLIAMRTLLKGMELEVIEASSFMEARELVKQHDFALILLDVKMPEMDGAELGKCIKSIKNLRSTPLMMLSSKGMKGEASELENIGTQPIW